ncbi:hypothetical protein D6D01_05942 [Aureobasidium pullulans]|uniref:Uncharacterized protein n=1 Tax=Aureobasidium pullulans TaxID=5580 RepID=A0A4S9L4K9_AURPU|nr:hypothetical protein D6D01_05942 [Aureobasidium pullulans]
MTYVNELVNAELNLVSTVNLLGLSMICGFPHGTAHFLMTRLQRMQAFPVRMTYLVQRLLRWLSCHNTEENVKSRLVQFIVSEVPAREIHRQPLPYLRVACVLSSKFLFGLIIDKNPLFADGFCFSMSYVDACLGLDVWVSAFERHLVYLGYVFKGLQNLPNRIEPFVKDVFTADEWSLVLLTWNTWLQQRAEKSRAEYQYVDSSVLALHSIAVSDVVLPFWSFKYTPVVAEKASNHLQHALILAKERIYRHITVDQDEILGFRINNAGFFAKYGYPWLYRQEDETDDRLFGLIATNNLLDVKEDLRRSA